MRVKRPSEFEELLTVMKDQVFETYKDALIFAACYGLMKEHRLAFKKSSEPIPLSVFNNDREQMIINVIAMSDCGYDPNIMSDDRTEEKLTIFEEYACGGLALLSNRLDMTDDQLTDALASIIMETNTSVITGIGSISELAET